MRSLRTNIFGKENNDFFALLEDLEDLLFVKFSSDPTKWLGWQQKIWTKESLIASAKKRIDDGFIIDAIIFLILAFMRSEESLSLHLQD